MGRTYGIDHLNIGEAKHYSDYSKLLLAQHRIDQMENNTNKEKIITHEFNVLTNIINPIKHPRSKNIHYSPILQGCMNTHSGRANFINFRIMLDSGRSSKIVMGILTSKLKQKNYHK